MDVGSGNSEAETGGSDCTDDMSEGRYCAVASKFAAPGSKSVRTEGHYCDPFVEMFLRTVGSYPSFRYFGSVNYLSYVQEDSKLLPSEIPEMQLK